MGAFLGRFNSADGVFNAFGVSADDRVGVEIELAVYEQESYEGHACVVFRQDEKLYSVEASHCSCNELNGQWCPVETTRGALEMMLAHGWKPAGSDEGAALLKKWIEPTTASELAELERQVAAAELRLVEVRRKAQAKLQRRRELLEAQIAALTAEANRLENL